MLAQNSEHPSWYRRLLDEESVAERSGRRLREAMLHGQAIDLLARLKTALEEINSFRASRERMPYDECRVQDYPIGSGMQWKRDDDESVSKLRLANSNDTLYRDSEPKSMREARYIALFLPFVKRVLPALKFPPAARMRTQEREF